MARPKKAPRERLQITLPVPLSKKLRRFAKSRDAELSAIVAEALSVYFRSASETPLETLASRMSKADREYLEANPE